jgi:hypothetical protein
LYKEARQANPGGYGALIHGRRVDSDVATHQSAAHYHRACSWSRQRLTLRAFADASKQASAGGRDEQIAIQHEPDTAEHFDFFDAAVVSEKRAHAREELLVIHMTAIGQLRATATTVLTGASRIVSAAAVPRRGVSQRSGAFAGSLLRASS